MICLKGGLTTWPRPLQNESSGKMVVFLLRSLYDFLVGEVNEVNQRQKYVSLIGLFVLYVWIYRTVDKRFLKQIWDVYKRVPAIHLVGNIVLFPDEFLLTRAPDNSISNHIDRKQVEAVKTARVTYLNTWNQSLTKEAQR